MIQPLKINKKIDNDAKIASIIRENIPTTEYMSADEVNSMVAKINEMVPAINVSNGGFQGTLAINEKRVDSGFYIPTESGTFINADNVQVDLSQGVNFVTYDGDKWDVAVVPLLADGKVEEGNAGFVSGGEVFGVFEEKANIEYFDRPDLFSDSEIVVVDNSKQRIESYIEERQEYFDRPDIIGGSIDDQYKNIDCTFLTSPKPDNLFFHKLNDFTAFDSKNSYINNYSNLITAYDQVLDNVNTDNYKKIEKIEYGISSLGSSLYAYKIKSKGKKTVIFTAGTHAREKMYIHAFLDLFKKLNSKNKSDYASYLLANFNFIFIPAVCPEALSHLHDINGSRATPESPPIKFRFKKEEDKTKLEIVDFPLINNNITKEDYFEYNKSKLYLTLYKKDNVLKENIVVKTEYISASEVYVNSENFLISEGIVTGAVWVDFNRNAEVGYHIWDNYSPSGEIYASTQGGYFMKYDNKGSKSNSLQELTSLNMFINKNNPLIVIDGHCPPRNNYCHKNPFFYISNVNEVILELKEYASTINSDNLDLGGFESFESWGNPTLYNSWTDFLGCVVEWGSGLNNATSQEVEDSINWCIACIIAFSNNLNK